MAGKAKSLMDIIGLLQHFRAGDSDREISRTQNIHRRTIRKYRKWATHYHLIEMEKLPRWEQFKNGSMLPLVKIVLAIWCLR